MDEIERIATEIFKQFSLTAAHPIHVLICNVVQRARDGDLYSAWWILEAFEAGWQYGSNAFKRSGDLSYQRYGEDKPSWQAEHAKAIRRLWQAVNDEVHKR